MQDVTPHTYVIPAEAGIQTPSLFMDPRLRGDKSGFPLEFTLMKMGKMGAGMTEKSEDKGKSGRCKGLLQDTLHNQ